MSDYHHLLYSVEDGIAIVTLNRPQRMNTFTQAMGQELIAVFDRTDADDAVKAVVVTGAGSVFCAGADLGEGGNAFDYDQGGDLAATKEAGVYRDGGGLVTLRIFDSLKPVIAAVNGAAAGFGATLQLAMDFRIAATGAKFGFVFSRRGIVAEACSSWFLPRLVGVQTALEWLYSGRVFGAQEALQKGLVHSVHTPETLLSEALALAHEVTDGSAAVSVAITRQMVWRMLGADHPMEAHKVDSRMLMALGKSADVREGIDSFLAKRPAQFPGKVSSDLPESFQWPARPFI